MRSGWRAVPVLVLWASVAAADERPWTIAGEGGYGRVHGEGAAGGTVRLSRSLGRSGLVRAQLGATAFDFGMLDAGLELRLCPSCRVSPVLGAGGGVMAEDEYTGTFLRGTVGVEAALAPRVTLRVTGQAGRHGGQRGPWLATVGVGWRF